MPWVQPRSMALAPRESHWKIQLTLPSVTCLLPQQPEGFVQTAREWTGSEKLVLEHFGLRGLSIFPPQDEKGGC